MWLSTDYVSCCLHVAEGPHRSVVAHSLYQSLSFLGVPDHKVGVVCLKWWNGHKFVFTLKKGVIVQIIVSGWNCTAPGGGLCDCGAEECGQKTVCWTGRWACLWDGTCLFLDWSSLCCLYVYMYTLGAKRLQALSTLVVAVMILPWALWQLSTQVVIGRPILCLVVSLSLQKQYMMIKTLAWYGRGLNIMCW